MRRMTFGAAMLAASLAVGACSDSPTQADQASVDDYALVFFGTSGAALQSTLGPQGGHPFDGRTGAPPFPDSIALSAEQQASIASLRAAFEAAHQTELDALRAVFEQARAAHDSHAGRDSIRTILEQGRTIAEGLRPAVEALHQSILAVFTPAQRAWLEANRPGPPPDVDGRPRPDPRHGRGGRPPG